MVIDMASAVDQTLIHSLRVMCAAALENKLPIEELIQRWAEEQSHRFFEQCFEDLEYCVEHVPCSLFTGGVLPEWFDSWERWYVEVDHAVLLLGENPLEMQKCRDLVVEGGIRFHGDELFTEVQRQLSWLRRVRYLLRAPV